MWVARDQTQAEEGEERAWKRGWWSVAIIKPQVCKLPTGANRHGTRKNIEFPPIIHAHTILAHYMMLSWSFFPLCCWSWSVHLFLNFFQLEIENPLASINLTPLKEKPVVETSPQSKAARKRAGRRRRGKYEYSAPTTRRKPINCCCEDVCDHCRPPRDEWRLGESLLWIGIVI